MRSEMLDGKDAPAMVDGKPSGPTMAIRSVDSRHMAAVVKFQGQQITDQGTLDR